MKDKKSVKVAVNFKEKLITFSNLSFAEVMRKLRTDFDSGLYDDELEYYHERYGYNEIENTNKNTWYKRLRESFITPFNMVLFVIIAISFFTDYYFAIDGERDLTSVVVISAMVFMSGILDFIQDTKSDKASEKLNAMITTKTTLVRNNKKVEVALREVVPGDIVVLSAGSIIPADLRILSAKDLFISQSSLTGESAPIEKFTESFCPLKKYERQESLNKIPSGEMNMDTFREDIADKDLSPLEMNNLCFMGTNVVSGSGVGVVISIGSETYFGSMAQSIYHKKVETNFDKGIKDIGWMLIKFVIIMAVAVFLINGIFKGDWVQSFIFAVSVAIGLTPEMLPVIVTTNLAKGAIVMSKKKTIVKNLSSIQNFGAMDILCTDKTGTLTEDKIVLEYHLNIHGDEDIRVFKHAYLNSYYQTGLKNLLDIAVLNHLATENDIVKQAIKKYHRIDEIPFDFSRKRMSVVLRDDNGKTQLITKGAVENMLDICGYVEYKGQVEELTDVLKEEVLQRMSEFNNQGMRVIGVAHKTRFDKEIDRFSVVDENDMVFLGFVAFLDPPKESAAKAIEELKKYNVAVKVLTGDNELVANYVCGKVGIGSRQLSQKFKNFSIPVLVLKIQYIILQNSNFYFKILYNFKNLIDEPYRYTVSNQIFKVNRLFHINSFLQKNYLRELPNCNTLLGSEIEYMSDKKLREVVNDIDIFAKLTPQHKSRVVTALRDNGHVVGFMGDGINDAPAMKKSDVAISVDSAVDIAKESADIILLEKDLKVLKDGVIEGRKIFGNIVKYIKMATSSNFGNMLSILVACAFLPFLPMLPLQILILNLFYDISQTVIPWDNMDEEYIYKQKKWDIKSIKRFMLCLGPASSIFDLMMFFILYFIFKCNDSNNQQLVSLFQTGWFVLSLITQTIIIHFVRTEKIPFLQSIASKPVIAMTIALVIIGLLLPFTGVGQYIKMVPLPISYFGWLAIVLTGYVITVGLVKKAYKKKYGNWL